MGGQWESSVCCGKPSYTEDQFALLSKDSWEGRAGDYRLARDDPKKDKSTQRLPS